MKKVSISVLLAVFCHILFAQPMHVKKHNLVSFRNTEKVVAPLLEKLSANQAKQHPEYGVKPYNSPCSQCFELIDKRDINSRLFIDPKDAGHTYSQQSFGPLHYQKQDGGIWHTIDPLLKSLPGSQN